MNSRDEQARDLDRPAMPPMGDVLRRSGPPLPPEPRDGRPYAPNGSAGPPPARPVAGFDDADHRPAASRPAPDPVESPLSKLVRLLEGELSVPPMGVQASKVMTNAFATVADEVVRLAKGEVARAQELEQRAISYAAILRQGGEELCSQIEDRTARLQQLSLVMRAAEKFFADEAPPK